MAAVVEPKDAAAKFNSQVDEQIAEATSRIRAHDLAVGGLAVLALVLVYATAMISLDRYLNLPEWVRQAALAGFVAVLAATAYLTLVRPLRRRINPLYAAKRVERTLDDPKNSVTGYVDARERDDLNATVKAALASKAAEAAGKADVNRAVDHRALVYLGAVAVVFVLALVVLFFVFRPAQFASLAGRAFAPFTPRVIETQTRLQLLKPQPAEPTVTTGQSVTVAVYVEGRVPRADGPERVRLLVRHNPADPNYDELPMVQGETSRDWELRVPDYLVQNGFWYKVAAGDDVTPEYKVTIRALPRFTEQFQVSYEYPKYLRRPAGATSDPAIKGPRGTTVTLVARTNRDARDGLMTIEPGNARVSGTVDPADPKAVRFTFKLADAGKYKLTYTATDGERSPEPFAGTIALEPDFAPRLAITKPEDDDTRTPPNETTEPANGLVKIEGKVGDDYGIDTVTLKMKIVEPGKLQRDLPDVPYLNGKVPSFRRDTDGTFPTDLDYKGSIDLAKLTKDASGLTLKLEPDMVIEYWLEATDNCTEPLPNVGVSNKKRVRLAPPKTAEPEQKNLDEQKQNRQAEEQKHSEEQKQKNDTEKREPPKKDGQPKQGDKGDKGDNPENKPGDPMPGDKGNNKPDAQPDPKNGGNPPKDAGDKKNPPDPKTDSGMPGGMSEPMGGTGDPKKEGDPKNNQKTDGKSDQKSGGAQDDPAKTAEDLKNELDRENRDGGSGKSNNAPAANERTDPGQAKPQPKDGPGKLDNPGDTKPEPKESKSDPADPKGGKPDANPSAGKPQGDVRKPEEPSQPKPEPKEQPGAKSGKGNSAPSEARREPLGAPPGTDKEAPQDQPPPKDPNAKQDPNSGSTAKPATEKKQPDAGAPQPGDKKGDPAADAGSQPKPMREPKRGDDKPSGEKPKGANDPAPKTGDPKPNEPNAGEAKPDKAPSAGEAKPQPKDGPTPMGKDADPKPAPGANDPMNPMKPNATNAAEARPDDNKDAKKNQTGNKPVEKGTDKPQPKGDKGEKGTGGGDDNKAPMPKEKLDQKQIDELKQAAQDLAGNDEKKKEEARRKLDKAIGEQNRKEMEKLANDLKSDDKATRDAAQKKLDDLKKQMEKGKGGSEPPKKDEPPEPTPEQKKELEKALNDLNSPDPDKKREARKKLDEMVGEQNRKEAEQLMEDLKSDDPKKREAAEKKVKDIQEKLKNEKTGGKGGTNAAKKPIDDPKGKEPSKEELEDLVKKAQDLQSPDEQTRKQAQKELDQKLGEENRKKLEEMMKNKKPDPSELEKLKEQMKKEWNQGPGSGTDDKGRMKDDPKNRSKSGELLLEDLKKEENRKFLQNKKGWTDAEYDKFLKDYERYLEEQRKLEQKEREKAPMPTPKDDKAPMFTPGVGGKVDSAGGASGSATGGSPAVPPPGFEGARQKFEDALKKKKP